MIARPNCLAACLELVYLEFGTGARVSILQSGRTVPELETPPDNAEKAFTDTFPYGRSSTSYYSHVAIFPSRVFPSRARKGL
ncbi:MAG TPA: hypothetical protein VG675_21690 [Bryobacteraceae bacterium]|nr:hypothetical protein [Bryobacteraceae bacterium]